MAVILVTGMSGAGKSTALAELARRGHRVVDTDEADWSENVPLADKRRTERLWREDKMNVLLAEHLAGTLFISGCVSNQALFYPRFDAVVLLSAPVDTLLARVITVPRTLPERPRRSATKLWAIRPLSSLFCAPERLLRSTPAAA